MRVLVRDVGKRVKVAWDDGPDEFGILLNVESKFNFCDIFFYERKKPKRESTIDFSQIKTIGQNLKEVKWNDNLKLTKESP